MRRDVVFNELASWYAYVKDDIGANVKENRSVENACAQSQTLSGPQGSPSACTSENPWSGTLHEKVSPAPS